MDWYGISKKFRKKQFDEILDDLEYSNFIEGLLELAMTKIMGNAENLNIDPESYEDIRSLSLELEDFDS